jgi:hypothetical protein
MTTAESIAESWGRVLFKEQIDRLEEILTGRNPGELANDFAAAARIFQKLDAAQRSALMTLLKVVIADTASIVLGSLDGSTTIDGIEKEFSVTYGGNDVRGELQDGFLAWIEDSGVFSK